MTRHDEAPVCMNRDCMAPLEYYWEFCPSCGWRIEWREILCEKQHEEPDDYEGVSRPLVMQR